MVNIITACRCLSANWCYLRWYRRAALIYWYNHATEGTTPPTVLMFDQILSGSAVRWEMLVTVLRNPNGCGRRATSGRPKRTGISKWICQTVCVTSLSVNVIVYTLIYKNNMATILQTIMPTAFLWMAVITLWLKNVVFVRNCLVVNQLTLVRIRAWCRYIRQYDHEM